MRRFSSSPLDAAMREVSYIGKVDRIDANTFASGYEAFVALGGPVDSFEHERILVQRADGRLVDTASNIAANAELKDRQALCMIVQYRPQSRGIPLVNMKMETRSNTDATQKRKIE